MCYSPSSSFRVICNKPFHKIRQQTVRENKSLEGIHDHDNTPVKNDRGDKRGPKNNEREKKSKKITEYQNEPGPWQLTKIQIQPFSGEMWSWKPWFIIFEKIMEGTGITEDKDKLLRLVTSLVGHARVYFGDLSYRVQNDYDLLVQAMNFRFGPDLGEEWAQFELRNMRQYVNEPLEMYGDRVLSIACEAYPDQIGIREREGARALVKGCNDENSRVYVFQEMRKMTEDEKKYFNVRKALELIKDHQRIRDVCLAEDRRQRSGKIVHGRLQMVTSWYGCETQENLNGQSN